MVKSPTSGMGGEKVDDGRRKLIVRSSGQTRANGKKGAGEKTGKGLLNLHLQGDDFDLFVKMTQMTEFIPSQCDLTNQGLIVEMRK